MKDGLLIEFIEPLEDNNNEYLVNWSDTLITIERVVNNKHYLDNKVDTYERYCTIPQQTKWCTTTPISSQLLKRVFSNLTNIMAQVGSDG